MASAEDTTKLQSAGNNPLYCGICLMPYKDPRNLPCGHTYCLKCIRDTKTNSCTSCITPFYTDIDNLPINFIIETFILSLPQIHRCSMAESEDHGPMEFFCIDCWDAFCDNCGKNHTKYTKLTKNHVIKHRHEVSQADIEQHLQYAAAFCHLHKTDEVAFYCLQCELTGCNKCFLTDHSKHEYMKINEANKTFAKKITKSVEELKTIRSIYDTRFQRTNQLKIQSSNYNNKLLVDLKRLITNIKHELQNIWENLLKGIDKLSEKAQKVISERSERDFLQLENFALLLRERIMNINKTIQSCEKHLLPTSSIIEKVKFMKSLATQLMIVDEEDESIKPYLLPLDISVLKSDIVNWQQMIIDSIDTFIDQTPCLAIADNEITADNLQDVLECVKIDETDPFEMQVELIDDLQNLNTKENVILEKVSKKLKTCSSKTRSESVKKRKIKAQNSIRAPQNIQTHNEFSILENVNSVAINENLYNNTKDNLKITNNGANLNDEDIGNEDRKKYSSLNNNIPNITVNIPIVADNVPNTTDNSPITTSNISNNKSITADNDIVAENLQDVFESVKIDETDLFEMQVELIDDLQNLNTKENVILEKVSKKLKTCSSKTRSESVKKRKIKAQNSIRAPQNIQTHNEFSILENVNSVAINESLHNNTKDTLKSTNDEDIGNEDRKNYSSLNSNIPNITVNIPIVADNVSNTTDNSPITTSNISINKSIIHNTAINISNPAGNFLKNTNNIQNTAINFSNNAGSNTTSNNNTIIFQQKYLSNEMLMERNNNLFKISCEDEHIISDKNNLSSDKKSFQLNPHMQDEMTNPTASVASNRETKSSSPYLSQNISESRYLDVNCSCCNKSLAREKLRENQCGHLSCNSCPTNNNNSQICVAKNNLNDTSVTVPNLCVQNHEVMDKPPSSQSIYQFMCITCRSCDIFSVFNFLDCGHAECKSCIKKNTMCIEKLAVYRPYRPGRCKSCEKKENEWINDQPPGTMRISFSKNDLPGYKGYGTISITYTIPKGYQGVSSIINATIYCNYIHVSVKILRLIIGQKIFLFYTRVAYFLLLMHLNYV